MEFKDVSYEDPEQVVVWVKDRQDHSHPEQACQCVVSVVHLGWVDPVPVDHSDRSNLSVVVTTQGSQVVAGYSNLLPAAQECREAHPQVCVACCSRSVSRSRREEVVLA